MYYIHREKMRMATVFLGIGLIITFATTPYYLYLCPASSRYICAHIICFLPTYLNSSVAIQIHGFYSTKFPIWKRGYLLGEEWGGSGGELINGLLATWANVIQVSWPVSWIWLPWTNLLSDRLYHLLCNDDVDLDASKRWRGDKITHQNNVVPRLQVELDFHTSHIKEWIRRLRKRLPLLSQNKVKVPDTKLVECLLKILDIIFR